MTASRFQTWLLFFIAGLVCLLAALTVHKWDLQFKDTAVLTGAILFGLMIFLAAFNARKRLSMLPLGKAKYWLMIHVAGGLVAIGLFWLHTRSLWPSGLYEQILAGLFYAISANGILGYFLQRLYPQRLTDSGMEVIYERIPREIAEIRDRAEQVVLSCTKETGTETLAKQYLEKYDWFFRRPRFFASHTLGDKRADRWLKHQREMVKRYLNAAEQGYLEQLGELAELKNKIDFHYSAQSLMKGWLLFHVPLASALMVLIVWHAAAVLIYRI